MWALLFLIFLVILAIKGYKTFALKLLLGAIVIYAPYLVVMISFFSIKPWPATTGLIFFAI